jgi:hypothetical protein
MSQVPQMQMKPMTSQPGSGAGIGIGMPGIGTGDDGAKPQLPIPPTVTAAAEILQKFEGASTPAEKTVHDSVADHALQDNTSLSSEAWAGTEKEKRDW